MLENLTKQYSSFILDKMKNRKMQQRNEPEFSGTVSEIRHKQMNKEIEDFMMPSVDYTASLRIGGVRYQQPVGPKENEDTGRLVQYTMIGDQRILKQG